MSASLLAQTEKITPPSIEYSSLSPLLIVFVVALIGVLVDAFAQREARRVIQPVLAAGGFIAAFVAVAVLHGRHALLAANAVAIDAPALFMQGTILVFALLSVLLVAERQLDSAGGAIVASAAITPGSKGSTAARTSADMQTEAYPLMVFSVTGMMLFVASNNLLVMFVALEILSLPLYLLAGLARRRRLLSQEAAMKYFLLGAFSSAFFLYGLAFAYGYAGSVELGKIATAVGTTGRTDAYLYLAVGLIAVGLFFKIGAVPFHSWTPDVYQGSPTPVTAFMAAGTKVAAFGAILRVFYIAFGPLRWDWRPVLWTVAILTMVVGAVLALTQRDIKRMLAYSAIAHAGFLLVGLAGTNTDGLRGAMFYLVTYGFTTIAAFAVISLVRTSDGEASDLSQWRGLGRTSPLLAGVFSFLLMALAGIPLTSGFTGKFAVFQAAIEGDATPLVVVALVCSAIAAFFYVRVIVLMFFSEPLADGPVVITRPTLTFATAGIGTLATLVLGVAPQPLLDLANTAASSGFVR
ncbi:NADH-quinone oxidoreductase subunit NuoN [Frankia sp. AgPm24]|uniref:NADH-quinone oxidoreductase subunit N n=1 Tax=Frankia umida TaxID=573489 RepID=A0ABT0JTT9_9ACTN|nr:MULTISPECIES: NADH-quinone oxidoreductase subunit NuoN [Frankia]MCK9874810.1 NADH-quinone oxidoreductase subunit NuoN [Frankia umida]MCK9924515.1 NADH-quinone oxidoreductase subunit NuoN [Frankia sp. AgPm24]